MLNAETLAHLALVARHGAGWFRATGTARGPRHLAVHDHRRGAHPGVLEAPRGTRLGDLLALAHPIDPAAVLVGGYHGAWVPGADLDTPLSRAGLAPYGAAVGAGVAARARAATPARCGYAADMAPLPRRRVRRPVRALRQRSAPDGRHACSGSPHGVRDARLPAEVERLRALVTGRGACAHPDGTARFVASTMRVFADHVAAHLAGCCPTERRERERPAMSRLHVDWTRCDGHGACAELLPELLGRRRLGLPGQPRTGERDPVVPRADEEHARHAVRRCPLMALPR